MENDWIYLTNLDRISEKVFDTDGFDQYNNDIVNKSFRLEALANEIYRYHPEGG